MLNDAMAGWKADTLAGLDSLLIAGDKDTVDALNRAAQRVLVDFGRIDPTGAGEWTEHDQQPLDGLCW
ncbi:MULTISPECIES: hypothetical protein [unclassified Corynebacterium]|uniref:hypothetical protein n=1 Tax=unclassified Corynebacterium TaxID=2624378 RepID=UPI001EF55789|nr:MULTISPECIES: hypothetical protein [unclassified Corynebacterium]MCG7258211.1 hypothetical protein [Corynebacterium sp. ACRQK]MCG7262644.1 hypothetical protein [Corynebacterium sp. ACRQL]